MPDPVTSTATEAVYAATAPATPVLVDAKQVMAVPSVTAGDKPAAIPSRAQLKAAVETAKKCYEAHASKQKELDTFATQWANYQNTIKTLGEFDSKIHLMTQEKLAGVVPDAKVIVDERSQKLSAEVKTCHAEYKAALETIRTTIQAGAIVDDVMIEFAYEIKGHQILSALHSNPRRIFRTSGRSGTVGGFQIELSDDEIVKLLVEKELGREDCQLEYPTSCFMPEYYQRDCPAYYSIVEKYIAFICQHGTAQQLRDFLAKIPKRYINLLFQQEYDDYNKNLGWRWHLPVLNKEGRSVEQQIVLIKWLLEIAPYTVLHTPNHKWGGSKILAKYCSAGKLKPVLKQYETKATLVDYYFYIQNRHLQKKDHNWKTRLDCYTLIFDHLIGQRFKDAIQAIKTGIEKTKAGVSTQHADILRSILVNITDDTGQCSELKLQQLCDDFAFPYPTIVRPGENLLRVRFMNVKNIDVESLPEVVAARVAHTSKPPVPAGAAAAGVGAGVAVVPSPKRWDGEF